MRTPLIAAAFLAAALAPAARADFAGTFTFTGAPGNQASEPVDAQPPEATFTDIVRGPGLTANAGANSINSANFTTAATRDDADYYGFSVTAAAGPIDLTELAFTGRRSGTGPLGFEVRYSLDGFASSAPVALFALADVTANFRQTIALAGVAALQGVTGTATFRIFGFAAEGAAGTFRLGVDTGDAGSNLPANLVLSGRASVAAVPEPASLALLGLGAIALAGCARRRRAA